MEVEMTRQLGNAQRTITATEIRRNFSAVVRRLRKRHEHTVIQSDGVPVAVLLPIAEYERLMARERLAAFNDFARKLGQEVEKRGLTEGELLADLENTKREVAEARYVRGRIELIPLKPIKKMRGFLKGMDTTIEREADRV
jgi:prevent-host-death family protein